jgi:hypothetical protein
MGFPTFRDSLRRYAIPISGPRLTDEAYALPRDLGLKGTEITAPIEYLPALPAATAAPSDQWINFRDPGDVLFDLPAAAAGSSVAPFSVEDPSEPIADPGSSSFE